ncbi:hypothetical protein FHS78_001949 [Parvibaculum indicum]|uniref:AAA family ATPase n=1 Tax=Parvibaculum indicum TaxID=562969 RepID=UPI00141FAA87|nr:AAA family ATPase [Parvibaculum indicum]NIJ41659.1 hypothetical protein [Parvibaculum indicum]
MSHSFLELWRRYEPKNYRLSTRVGPFVHRLVREIQMDRRRRDLPVSAAESRMLERLQDPAYRMQQAIHALKLAASLRRLSDHGRVAYDDIVMSLIFVAARLRSQTARLELGARLRERMANEDVSAAEAARLLRLAEQWESGVNDYLFNHADLHRELGELDDDLEDEDAIDVEADRPWQDARGVMVRDGQPFLQVLDSVGEDRSHEGKRIVGRFQALLQPLPLAGFSSSIELLDLALKSEFPWFEELIDAVCGTLRLRSMAGEPWFRLSPILIVGPPGCGKSRFAQRLGDLSGAGSALVSVAGASDNRMLAGTARGYATAQPSFPLIAIERHRTANPVLVVDEIEKAGGSARNGNVQATLLNFLEPGTAQSYFDECLLSKARLAQVSWIALANSLEHISEPLLNRFEVFRVGGPEPDHFDAVIASLRRDIATDLGLEPDLLPAFSARERRLYREAFEKGVSVRKLRSLMMGSFRIGPHGPPLQ